MDKKQEANQAIPTEPASNIFAEIAESGDDKVADAVAKDKDNAIAGLVGHPGWATYKKMVLDVAEELKNLSHANLDGAKLEDVGLRFLIASTAADKILKTLLLPENINRNYNRVNDSEPVDTSES